MHERMAFDRNSRRRLDANGFLHVAVSHISKEAVNDYYGHEIPGWRTLGLDPGRVYRGYRPAAELLAAAPTFNGLPLLKEHVKDSAEDPQKELRIGNLGTDAAFRAPYLDNSLIIQDAEAIAALNPSDPGTPGGRSARARRELSASYRYDPVMRSGVFQGQPYDFIMTNIRGNHVALVEEGRAGPDVVVADANSITKRGRTMNLIDLLKDMLTKNPAAGAGGPSGGDMDPQASPQAPLQSGETPGPEEEAEDCGGAAVPPEGTEPPDELAGARDSDIQAAIGKEVLAYAARLDRDAATQFKQNILTTLAEKTAARAEGKDGGAKEGKPAMDMRPGGRARFGGRIVDEDTLIARVTASFQERFDAGREVNRETGYDLNPLSFDSAASIYRKGLNILDVNTPVTDLQSLRDIWKTACEARRNKRAYPVVSFPLANDSGGKADPVFVGLARIRRA